MEAVIELRKKNGPLDIAGGEAALRAPKPELAGVWAWLTQPSSSCNSAAALLSAGSSEGLYVCVLHS